MKNKLVVFTCLISLAGGGAYCLISFFESPITLDNFCKINEGMTMAEVEAILGPPGHYATSCQRYTTHGETDSQKMEIFLASVRILSLENQLMERSNRIQRWISDYCFIYVKFDQDGHVEQKESMAVWPDESFLERIWQRIKK